MLLDLVQLCGLSPRWQAATSGGEYSSPCPSCGGDDRFRIQPNKQNKNCVGRYFCRQCLKKGDTIQFCIDFLNDDYKSAIERLGISSENVKTVRSLLRIPQPHFIAQPLIIPNDIWILTASLFIEWSHENIFKFPDILQKLTQRGLSIESIKRYKIGYCPQELFRDKGVWGLEDDGKKVWLAKGIVIPSFFNNAPIRIKIRRDDYNTADELPKYAAVTGSSNGVNFIGSPFKRMGIVVESELDAYMLHAQLDGQYFTIGTGSCTRNPDEYTHEIVSFCRKIFIAYDNDEGGKKMLKKWKSIYKNSADAVAPFGKDIGEAFEQGLNIKQWFENIKNPPALFKTGG